MRKFKVDASITRWINVVESKRVFCKISDSLTGKERFVPVGTRITMEDGGWWFHTTKRGTWTYHPVPIIPDATVAAWNMHVPEKKDRHYSSTVALRHDNLPPRLIVSLLEAIGQ